MKFLVALTEGLKVDDNYFPELFAGFSSAAAEQGHEAADVLVSDLCRELSTAHGAALVLTGVNQFPLLEAVHERGFPIVAINHYSGAMPIPCVRIDDGAGVEQVVDQLASLRHTRIGFIAGDEDNLDARDRLAGFLRGAEKHGIDAHVRIGGFSEPDGYEAAREMLTPSPRPTAIVCAGDLTAVGVVRAAREMSISVPVELSIAGFGDFPMVEYVYPSITTVRQPRYELGRAAARLLIDAVAGAAVDRVVLPAEFVPRESTVVNFVR